MKLIQCVKIKKQKSVLLCGRARGSRRSFFLLLLSSLLYSNSIHLPFCVVVQLSEIFASSCEHVRLLVLLLLMFEQFVDLPLGHGGVL